MDTGLYQHLTSATSLGGVRRRCILLCGSHGSEVFYSGKATRLEVRYLGSPGSFTVMLKISLQPTTLDDVLDRW